MNSKKSGRAEGEPEKGDRRGATPSWAVEWAARRETGGDEASDEGGGPSVVENFEALAGRRGARPGGWERSPYIAMVAAGAPAAEATPKAGDICLLNPRLPLPVERPVFVLVLTFREAARRWLVAPFSPLSEAVVPGELVTGIDEPGLRVLSLWNAEALAPGLVGCSQRVQSVGEGLLRSAMRDLGRRPEGLPAHPLDPRWEYIEAEGGLLAPLRCFEPAPVFQAKGTGGGGPAGMDLVMAANVARQMEFSARFRIADGASELRLSAGGGSGADCRVRVCDPRGDKSLAWDGSRLLTFAGVSAPVRDGATAMALPSLGEGFALADAAGELVPLEPAAGGEG